MTRNRRYERTDDSGSGVVFGKILPDKVLRRLSVERVEQLRLCDLKGMNRAMDIADDNQAREKLSYKEKNHQLFLREKALLAEFPAHGAISRAQHDKSLHDLIEKTGEAE